MRIAGSIWRFWQNRTRMTEGLAWTAELLAQPMATDAVVTDGTMDGTRRDAVLARLAALSADAGMAYWNRDFVRCRAGYTERLALATGLGDDAQIAEGHYEIGFLGMIERDPDYVRRHEEAALELFERLGDTGGAVRARQALVIVSFLTRDFATARELEIINLAQFRRMGAAYRYHDSLVLLAGASVFEGDLVAGRAYLRESTRLTSGVVSDQISGVVMAAHIALRSGQEELGARLAGAADAASDDLGVTNAALEILHVDPAEVARERLGYAADALIADGRSMSLDEALAIATDIIGTD
jgi:hypothetical protein